MRAVPVLALTLLAGCSTASPGEAPTTTTPTAEGWSYTAPDGRTVTQADFDEAVAPLTAAGVDAEEMAGLALDMCDQIREYGDGGMANYYSALQDAAVALTEQEAARAVAAWVVRYCPELTSDG